MRIYEIIKEGYKEAQSEFSAVIEPAKALELINQYKVLCQRNQVVGQERNIDYWRKQGVDAFAKFVQQNLTIPSKTEIKRSKITLRPFNFNPFGLDGFDTIWKERMADVIEDCLDTLETPSDTNVKFIIFCDNSPIGITGYYMIDGRAIMAWHGVIESMRGKRYSEEALKQLVLVIRKEHPGVTELTELVPADRETVVGAYFKKIGFVPNGAIFEHPDFVQGVVWKEYVLTIA